MKHTFTPYPCQAPARSRSGQQIDRWHRGLQLGQTQVQVQSRRWRAGLPLLIRRLFLTGLALLLRGEALLAQRGTLLGGAGRLFATQLRQLGARLSRLGRGLGGDATIWAEGSAGARAARCTSSILRRVASGSLGMGLLSMLTSPPMA